MQIYYDKETIPQQPEAESKATLLLTIEPPSAMSKADTIAEWMSNSGKYADNGRRQAVDEAYGKTALNGAKGQICSLAWSFADSEETNCIMATPSGLSEKDILITFFDSLRQELKGAAPYFVGHFISGFDLPFLFHRCVINRVDPSMPLGVHGRHGKDFYDTMIAWAGYKNSISLDNLCTALGIDRGADIKGSQVWEHYKEGQFDLIKAHNIADVERVRKVHRRMIFAA